MRTWRFVCMSMCLDAICAHYIMHNDDMQAYRNHMYLAHNPRLDHTYLAYCMMHAHTSRLDHMNNHMMMYSRDRNRHRT